MTIRIFLLLTAFLLTACTRIDVDEAEVDNPMPKNGKQPQLKTLNKAAREALNATNPDDLIAVFTENGVILYGANGKAFKFVPNDKDPISARQSKVYNNPVNDVNIKTFVNSPLCQLFSDGSGGGIWYPSDCPYE